MNRHCEFSARLATDTAKAILWQSRHCLQELGETRKAIEFYGQALIIAREIGDRRGEGKCSWQLGNRLWRPRRDA